MDDWRQVSLAVLCRTRRDPWRDANLIKVYPGGS